jgi:hypothetical protein
MATIWRGDRVRVATDNPNLPVGTVGFYVGGYEEESDAPTVLIRLRDRRKIRAPWTALESMEESVMDGNWSWKTDIPESDYRHRIHTVDMARTSDGRTSYELRGSSARWFIVRTRPGEPAKRTTFFPNQRTAHKVFNVLAYDATC